jgi:hypothetical protein
MYAVVLTPANIFPDIRMGASVPCREIRVFHLKLRSLGYVTHRLQTTRTVRPAVVAGQVFEETLMKADRFVALVAAVLITLFLAGLFTHEKVGAPLEQTQAAAPTGAATDIHPPDRHEIGVSGARRTRGIGSALILIALLGSTAAAAAPPGPCDMRLNVELTPDVPNPGDGGFLSSLLGDHTGYELTLRRQRDGSVIVVELSGPGPDYLCRNVVEAMRRDGRVLSVRVHGEAS